MSEDRIGPLRRVLERIDSRLLAILTGVRPLDDASLEKMAVLETARGAILRLLNAAELEPSRPAARPEGSSGAGDHA